MQRLGQILLLVISVHRSLGNQQLKHFSGHNLNNQQLKHRRCFTYDYTQNQLKRKQIPKLNKNNKNKTHKNLTPKIFYV